MKRLGMYSGKVYEDTDPSPEECCQFIQDEEAANENRLRVLRTMNTVTCKDCYSCPESTKEH